ncbi:hypothetical protein B0A58_01015 [Flavobacterium branchiophilum NBRC 15030 = ATCC 35035]|nr:hypothetical protein B0A58_01015 [Flavobacterium branchiophilum NBRC 15030 = ATCC 35035]
MDRNNDVYYVFCKVNGIPLNFIFNMGSSDVSISLTEASFMIRMDFLKMKISERMYIIESQMELLLKEQN